MMMRWLLDIIFDQRFDRVTVGRVRRGRIGGAHWHADQSGQRDDQIRFGHQWLERVLLARVALHYREVGSAQQDASEFCLNMKLSAP